MSEYIGPKEVFFDSMRRTHPIRALVNIILIFAFPPYLALLFIEDYIHYRKLNGDRDLWEEGDEKDWHRF